MSGWFQPKAEEATTEPSIQDRAIAAKDQAGSFLGEKAEAVTTAASDTAEAAAQYASETAQVGKDSAVETQEAQEKTAQYVQDRAVECKDQTGAFLGETADAAKQKGHDTDDFFAEKTEAAKEKAIETAQYVQDRASDAADYIKADPPVAAEDNTGNVFQQAGGQVVGAAVGAKDAVMNTLGMGGDAAAEKK